MELLVISNLSLSSKLFEHEIGYQNAIIVCTTLVPYIKASGELKTKPTQQAIRTLQSVGLRADIIACRSEVALDDEIRDKISLFCDVPSNHVFDNAPYMKFL